VIYLLISPSIQDNTVSVGCLHKVGDVFFNLKPLERKKSEGDYSVDQDVAGQGTTLQWNFCNPTFDSCNGQDDYANMASNVTNTCTHLTGDSLSFRTVSLLTFENGSVSGISVNYTGGSTCLEDSSQFYGFVAQVYCQKGGAPASYNYDPVSTALSGGCTVFVNMYANEGCLYPGMNELWMFVEEYSIMFAIGAMLLGIFLIFFGLKMLKPTLFIFGFLSTVCLLLLLFYGAILPADHALWIGWVVLGGSIIFGILVGYFTAKIAKIGLFLLGAWLGYIVGLILYGAFLYTTDSQVTLWVTVSVLAVVFGGLSFLIYEHAVIFGTSIVGAYMLIRGISLLAGGFPNEYTLIDDIKSGHMDGVGWKFYVYMVSMLLAAIIGIIFQEKWKNRNKEDARSRADYMQLTDYLDNRRQVYV